MENFEVHCSGREWEGGRIDLRIFGVAMEKWKGARMKPRDLICRIW